MKNPLRLNDSKRVIRGGDWYGSSGDLRSARRDSTAPSSRFYDIYIGFRLFRTTEKS